MTKPRVSVCTSVLNQSNFLRRMIESVRAQTFSDWELIIVDDGSTENIAEVVGKFDDSRIKLHHLPANLGIPHGLNKALSLATGDYLQPLSADEWIEKDKFRVQVEYLDAHDEIDCVWGIPGKEAHGFGKRPEWEQNVMRAHNRSREAWIRTLLNLENIPIGGASLLMRRSCYEEIGGFDPELFGPSDLEWYVRFFKKFNGKILPYRWADADQPDTRLTAPKEGAAERFQKDMRYVHEKHALEIPPVSGRVTVGIPVYNMARFLPDAIKSVLAQTVTDFELIVMDDGSTDDIAGAMAQFDDPRIRYFKLEKNGGTVAALNAMVALAEGLFFMSVAADDTIEPNLIAKCLERFKRNPWLEFVATQTDFLAEDGSPFTGESPLKQIPAAVNKTRVQWLDQLYYGNHYFGVGMYRTSVLCELGGWEAKHGVLTDYEMYLRLLQRENIEIVEEKLTHTRIHGGNQSLLNQDEARKLKQRYHDARLPFYPPRMKVIIATPFYEMRGFSPYIVSMCATVRMLTQLGIDHEFWELSGDSYVDRAKNTLTNKFLEDPDATDLFIVDSDMQWEPQAFIKMLMLPEQIVMGSYPQKNSWDKWTSVPKLVEEAGKLHPVGRQLDDGSALIQAEFVSGGFIRMKRQCLEDFREKYKDFSYQDPSADSSCPDRVYTEFYTIERADGLRWGEDRVFGKRMKAIGHEGWIYPNCMFGHYGIRGWMGNYDQHLRGNKQANA